MTMSFGLMALILTAGLLGPMLAGFRRFPVPIVVGQILAGILIGSTGLGLVPIKDTTIIFLSNMGFATLMFLVGTNLPLRNPALRSALGRGFLSAGLAFVVGIPVALVLSHFVGITWTLLFLLVSTSSSQIVLPIVAGQKLGGRTILLTTTWVAIADASTLIILPVAAATGNPTHIVLGMLAIAALAVVFLFALRTFKDSRIGEGYRQMSKEKKWALDLQLSLIVLFTLAQMALHFGTSILIAGFAAGSIVQLMGPPKRFFKQLIGLAQGFFVPVFFVDLGAKLDFSALIYQPSNLLLTAAIAVSSIAVHMLVAKLVKLPYASGLTATAQMGGPIAIVAVGMANKLMTSGQGAAIIAGALVSVFTCSIGVAILARDPANADVAPPPPPDPHEDE